jgi:hypothetical protein
MTPDTNYLRVRKRIETLATDDPPMLDVLGLKLQCRLFKVRGR